MALCTSISIPATSNFVISLPFLSPQNIRLRRRISHTSASSSSSSLNPSSYPESSSSASNLNETITSSPSKRTSSIVEPSNSKIPSSVNSSFNYARSSPIGGDGGDGGNGGSPVLRFLHAAESNIEKVTFFIIIFPPN